MTTEKVSRLESRTDLMLDAALVRHALRLVRHGAIVVIIVAAGMSALVVWQYRGLTADGFDPASMQALANSPAIRVMFGEPVALADPGGSTVWRTGTPLAVLVAAWAALVAVRITRGEEQAGRWTLLLAGPVRLTAVLGMHLAVIMGVVLVTGAAVTVAMIMAGAASTGALLYGIGLALIGIGAAAWGGLVGQLVGDRRRASILAAAGIAADLLLRMVADSEEALRWLHWLSPFGLLGLVQPFAADRVAPLVALLIGGAVLGLAAVLVSRRRDVGAGVLPARTRHRSWSAGLRSVQGFAGRRSVGPLAAWATGIWLYFLVIGLLASGMTTFLADNPVFAELAAQAGFGSLTTVPGYLSSLFALLTVPVGLFAATRISAAAGDEDARLHTLVLAAPVTRTRWFLTEAVAAVAGAVLLAAGAGLAAWVGATAAGVEPGLAASVGGSVNVLPVAWLSLGAALVAYGWFPQLTGAIGAIPVVGGFLLQVLAESLQWPGWVLDLSPYAHLNAVPYEGVNWTGAIVMTLIACCLVVIGVVGFRRRDLRG